MINFIQFDQNTSFYLWQARHVQGFLLSIMYKMNIDQTGPLEFRDQFRGVADAGSLMVASKQGKKPMRVDQTDMWCDQYFNNGVD